MSEMWRWVDPRVGQVTTANLQQYLTDRGWKLKAFPQPQVLIFEEPAASGQEPVVQIIPKSESSKEFVRAVIDAITSLSALEDRHPVDVLNDVLHAVPNGAPAPNGAGRSEGATASA